MARTTYGLVTSTLVLALVGCSPTVTLKHEVAPIHITVDVNVKVQQELENFFDFEDEDSDAPDTTTNDGGEG